jgi:hypothetical protein
LRSVIIIIIIIIIIGRSQVQRWVLRNAFVLILVFLDMRPYSLVDICEIFWEEFTAPTTDGIAEVPTKHCPMYTRLHGVVS